MERTREGFWTVIRRLRSEGRIQRQWRRRDISDALVAAGYSMGSVNTIPSNQSISRDGKVKGNYVNKGLAPQAYRVGPGTFELIDEIGSNEPTGPSLRIGITPRLPEGTGDAAGRLIRAISSIAPTKRSDLNLMKQTQRWEQPDFIWEALLLSMATMGNSRGAVLVKEDRHHSLVTWEALASLTAKQRPKRLDETLRAAKVRMAAKKALWLSENFERIERQGGPAAVKCNLEECNGRDAKIAFLRVFDGVGPKYARNILMDVYHPDFRNSIAVDERIKKVSKALEVKFRTYADEERFYLDVAEAVELNGWELDRLLYNFTDQVLRMLTP